MLLKRKSITKCSSGGLLGFFASKSKNIKEIRYQGLMIGIDLAFPCNEVRTRLVKEYKMLTGNASTPNTLRVLPALNVKKEDVKKFADALIQILKRILKFKIDDFLDLTILDIKFH